MRYVCLQAKRCWQGEGMMRLVTACMGNREVLAEGTHPQEQWSAPPQARCRWDLSSLSFEQHIFYECDFPKHACLERRLDSFESPFGDSKSGGMQVIRS